MLPTSMLQVPPSLVPDATARLPRRLELIVGGMHSILAIHRSSERKVRRLPTPSERAQSNALCGGCCGCYTRRRHRIEPPPVRGGRGGGGVLGKVWRRAWWEPRHEESI